jgi:hypothetical protein
MLTHGSLRFESRRIREACALLLADANRSQEEASCREKSNAAVRRSRTVRWIERKKIRAKRSEKPKKSPLTEVKAKSRHALQARQKVRETAIESHTQAGER